MIEEHIEQIEAKLQSAGAMPEQTRNELLALLASLKTEVSLLSETHRDEAASVARLAAESTREATRDQQQPELLQATLDEFNDSVSGLEVSHPQLTQVVNRIAVTLSNMGI